MGQDLLAQLRAATRAAAAQRGANVEEAVQALGAAVADGLITIPELAQGGSPAPSSPEPEPSNPTVDPDAPSPSKDPKGGLKKKGRAR